MKRTILTILILTGLIFGAGDIYYDVNHHSNDVTGIGEIKATTGTFEYLIADVTISGGVSVAYVDTQDTGIRNMVSNNFLLKSGGTMTGDIDMGGHDINNIYTIDAIDTIEDIDTIDNISAIYTIGAIDTISSINNISSIGILRKIDSNVSMANHVISNLANGVSANDAANLGQVQSMTNECLQTSGGTMTGDIGMNGTTPTIQTPDIVAVGTAKKLIIKAGGYDKDMFGMEATGAKIEFGGGRIGMGTDYGGTMSISAGSGDIKNGDIVIPVSTMNTPTSVVTKGYVDTADNQKLNLTGGSLSGNLNINMNKYKLDSAEIYNPGDGSIWFFEDLGAKYFKMSDGNFILPQDPSVAMGAATKNYVDSATNAVGTTWNSRWVDVSGDTMTGDIDMYGHDINNISGINDIGNINNIGNINDINYINSIGSIDTLNEIDSNVSMANHVISNLANGVSANDAVNLGQLDEYTNTSSDRFIALTNALKQAGVF